MCAAGRDLAGAYLLCYLSLASAASVSTYCLYVSVCLYVSQLLFHVSPITHPAAVVCYSTGRQAAILSTPPQPALTRIYKKTQVAHAQSADEQQSSDKLVRAASERQIQEAVDGHSGDDTLTILLSGSVRLTRSINLRKGTGPVRFAASKAPSKSAEGVPQPAAALDGTRIKPAAPVLVVSNAAALTISGLSFTGPKGAPAIYARQSGPISVTDSIFKNNNNTGAYVDPPHGGAIACLGCQQLSIEGSSFDSNAATIGGAIFAVNLAKGIQVKGSWMLANQGGSEGGSVAIANSVAEFSNCTFRKSEVRGANVGMQEQCSCCGQFTHFCCCVPPVRLSFLSPTQLSNSHTLVS